MYYQKGQLPTAEASRIMVRLCYHFSKKIAVEYTEEQGTAHFDWGDCHMQAGTEHIQFECQASSAELLARVQHVLDEHVALFSRKAPMRIEWDESRPLSA
ncbi:DUF2218 domain-containing protein [Curvibacter sp. CHRR-16]|uniref:DUF2218 domain-containing protein n=1 Tax=Curvibacter sp. CHRR-16 TaxID=2835872 RepID=UPI001BD9256C|nr:DUF2218 domain-containing protein [Curvibacter sp. CHRR-16]MBT0570226.1 DUF2218 domain-containing protein [Curvibacter sp. CHRR-16]